MFSSGFWIPRSPFASYSCLCCCQRSTLAPSFRSFGGLQARAHSLFSCVLLCSTAKTSSPFHQFLDLVFSLFFLVRISLLQISSDFVTGRNKQIPRSSSRTFEKKIVSSCLAGSEPPTSQHLHSWTQQEPETSILLQHLAR